LPVTQQPPNEESIITGLPGIKLSLH